MKTQIKILNETEVDLYMKLGVVILHFLRLRSRGPAATVYGSANKAAQMVLDILLSLPLQQLGFRAIVRHLHCAGIFER